jgi:ADP-ribose pyrophosphatase
MGEAKLIGRRELHRGSDLVLGLDQVELPNGRRVELEMVRHPGAAAVVPFVSVDEIVLIRQYRWAAGGWILEVPAGKRRPGEELAHCAARELTEEIGLRAGRLEPLGEIWTVPGFSDERIGLYAAYDLTSVPAAPEGDELIELVHLSLDAALDLVRAGTLCDAKSICALMQVLLRRLELRGHLTSGEP